MSEFTITTANTPDDAIISALLAELGYPMSRELVASKLDVLGRGGDDVVMVAEVDGCGGGICLSGGMCEVGNHQWGSTEGGA
jgi:hypothetical protein